MFFKLRDGCAIRADHIVSVTADVDGIENNRIKLRIGIFAHGIGWTIYTVERDISYTPSQTRDDEIDVITKRIKKIIDSQNPQ